MGKLPALVSALASVDGRERASVDHVARTIRERGYITTGKRGGGAANMVAREAANLLIALNGADSPKEAGVAIDRFRSLRQMYAGSASVLKARIDNYDSLPKPLQDVMDTHTFGEALDALIDGVPDLAAAFYIVARNAFERTIEQTDRELASMIRLGFFGLEVTFERYAASIELYSMNGSTRWTQFSATYVKDMDRLESGFYGSDWPDRKVRVTIGFYTLLTLWQALNAGQSLPGFPARVAVESSPE